MLALSKQHPICRVYRVTTANSHKIGFQPINWGSWIRTSECRSQSPVPYRLAIPQYQSTFLGLLINTQFQKYFAVCAFSYFLYKYYIIIFFKNQCKFTLPLYIPIVTKLHINALLLGLCCQ